MQSRTLLCTEPAPVIQCKCLIPGVMFLSIPLLQISSKPFLLLQQSCSQYPLNVYNPCSVHPNRVFYELIFAMFKGYQPSQVFIFGRVKTLMSFDSTVSCINKGKNVCFIFANKVIYFHFKHILNSVSCFRPLLPSARFGKLTSTL